MARRRSVLLALVFAVLMGLSAGCGVVLADVVDDVTIESHGEAVSVGYAEIAEGWTLVVGGDPGSDLGEGQWQVMADVVATNVGDESREMYLGFDYLMGDEVVLEAVCVSAADDVAPGDEVELGCAGPSQVTPGDFDSIRVRALN